MLTPVTFSENSPLPSSETVHSPTAGPATVRIEAGTNPPEGMTVSTPGSPACTVVPSGRLTVMLDAPLDENVTRLIVESTGTVSVFVPVLRSPATLRTSTPLERTTKSASFVMLPASARESTKTCPPVSFAMRMYPGSIGEQLPKSTG